MIAPLMSKKNINFAFIFGLLIHAFFIQNETDVLQRITCFTLNNPIHPLYLVAYLSILECRNKYFSSCLFLDLTANFYHIVIRML